jgi:group I intron endonuclease
MHLGYTNSQESKDKMSKSNIGKHSHITEEEIVVRRNRMLGNTNTLGYKASKETKDKMSKAKKGKQYKLGKAVSEETKKKIGETLKNYYSNFTDEERKKHGDKFRGPNNYNFGKKMPEEQKQRMIKNMKRRKEVEYFNLDHQLLGRFYSASEAARKLGFRSSSSISHCCLGHTNTAHGYIWRFVETE